MNKSVLYIIRRFFFYCLAGFMAVTLNFIIPRLMPGDPASIMFAQFKGKLKPEALDALKETFGFAEGPIILQYFDYLKHLLNGDFGISISYFPQPVTEVISSGLYWTLFLAGTSLVISFVLGSLIGVYLAWYRDQKLDSILLPSLSFLGAFPYFFIAMLFLYYFGFILGWFPLRHAFGESVTAGFNLEFIFSVITHSILPAFTLIFVTLGGWVLSMRNNMISTLGADYITYAIRCTYISTSYFQVVTFEMVLRPKNLQLENISGTTLESVLALCPSSEGHSPGFYDASGSELFNRLTLYHEFSFLNVRPGAKKYPDEYCQSKRGNQTTLAVESILYT